MSEPQFPRWMIDDTSGIADARVFVAHMQSPRFVGELLPDDEAPIDGITISAPLGQTVCRICWFDSPVFDASELSASLKRAIEHHDNSRG